MKRCTFEADCEGLQQPKRTLATKLQATKTGLVSVGPKDRQGRVAGSVEKAGGEEITHASLGEIFQAIAATKAKLLGVILDIKGQRDESLKFGNISISTKPNPSSDMGTVAVEILGRLEKLQLAVSSLEILASEEPDRGMVISCTTQKPGADTEEMGRVATAIEDALKEMQIEIKGVARKDVITPSEIAV